MLRSPYPSDARPASADNAFAETTDANNELRVLTDTAVGQEVIIDEYDIDAQKGDQTTNFLLTPLCLITFITQGVQRQSFN